MGLGELFGTAVRDKRFQSAALEVASTCASASPVIKIVQAANKLAKVGDVVGHANDFFSGASQTVKTAQVILPQMHILGQSLVDSAKLFHQFSIVATTLSAGANIIQTYQGIQALNLIAAKLGNISDTLQAQAALTAQRDFPQYVFDMIRERLSQTSVDQDREHWFFLWHPDTDWYPKFFHLIEEKKLSPRFCGYTNQLDTVFMFMLAARERITKREMVKARRRQHCKPVQLHLIIPAYQTILIPDRIKIPEEIGDFVIEGRINSNRPFVWLNLPDDQQHFTFDVGMWSPPESSLFEKALEWMGLSGKLQISDTPRVLGLGETIEMNMIEDEKPGMTIEEITNGPSTDMIKRAATESQMDLVVNKHQSIPMHEGRKRRWRRRGSR
ncbi:uncharacterized protein FIESC28_00411 [Fusarium coffeatum]|uniref:Uncharacterized protein n=1 Tax=Fusarium coffeatum TaxID=231269 RepID=A0A366SDM6_9HYPO|nr:uncharacterized protein FIESC28_00411 [Fusarium coffeatum]RBR26830.1 hypothetical protein FIESC28_00411 [Fusarium coffeatum]